MDTSTCTSTCFVVCTLYSYVVLVQVQYPTESFLCPERLPRRHSLRRSGRGDIYRVTTSDERSGQPAVRVEFFSTLSPSLSLFTVIGGWHRTRVTTTTEATRRCRTRSGKSRKKNQSFQVRGFALTFFRGVCVCVKELSLSETLSARGGWRRL